MLVRATIITPLNFKIIREIFKMEVAIQNINAEAQSFYNEVMQSADLTMEYLLGISQPMNVKLENMLTLMDVI